MPGCSLSKIAGGSNGCFNFYITLTFLLGTLSFYLSQCETADNNLDLLDAETLKPCLNKFCLDYLCDLSSELEECPGKPIAQGKKLPPEFFPIQEHFRKNNITFYLYKNSELRDKDLFHKSPIFSTEDLGAGFYFKILIHGFMSSCESFEKKVIPEYLRDYSNIHVVCLDWSYQANPKEAYSAYKPTISILPNIAKISVEFLDTLLRSGLIEDLSEVHLVGFSLGAHLAGIIGSYAEKDLGSKVGRITGLDPAGPEFDVHESNEMKLDKSDANFVDVIHTSHGRLGTSKDLGHADFYMHDGKYQPRCLQENDSVARIAESVTGYCSHRSAIIYFAESIQNRMFKVCRCKSYKKLQKGKCKCADEDGKVVFGEHCTNECNILNDNCNDFVCLSSSVPEGNFSSFFKIAPIFGICI